MILRDEARFALALRLRDGGLPLGELFIFISGLYFRGKLAYARAFAKAPSGLGGAFIITASRGLVSPEEPVGLRDLQEMLAVPIEHDEPRYRAPLERDSRLLCDRAGAACQIVLLGSIATRKYVDPLLGIFGERLLFPAEFVGRGDMSRGGLMLRCVDSGTQLTYVPVSTAVRHGPRPPRLSRTG
jgi:hypothetical protein